MAYVDQGPSPAGNPGPYLHADLIGGDTTHRIYSRYSPGDLIWVRETWWDRKDRFHKSQDLNAIHYDADYWIPSEDISHIHCRRPSIFMPRWASRITLEITDVRVERVQEISSEDVIREGVYIIPESGSRLLEDFAWLPEEKFRPVWDSINLKRGYGWEVNPWVWVIEFKRIAP